MIELNRFRQNIYMNFGWRECPHYGEDGVILKIFDTIGTAKKPFCIEFGESRVFGTTTRSYQINYKAKALYFTGNYSFKSYILNLVDVAKATYITKDLEILRLYNNMPFYFFVTTDNIIDLLSIKVDDNVIDILSIDID